MAADNEKKDDDKDPLSEAKKWLTRASKGYHTINTARGEIRDYQTAAMIGIGWALLFQAEIHARHAELAAKSDMTAANIFGNVFGALGGAQPNISSVQLSTSDKLLCIACGRPPEAHPDTLCAEFLSV